MSSLCSYCNRGRPVIRATDLSNPHTECLNCGAVVALPEMRYRIDWRTVQADDDGHPWFEFMADRAEALKRARSFLKESLDRAVVTDRWGIEKPITLIKQMEAQR